MYINQNNPDEQFLQLSPLFGQPDDFPPSPLLTPDQRPLQQHLQFEPFALNSDSDPHPHALLSEHLDDLTPPIPHPSNRYMLDPDQKSQGFDQDLSEDPPLLHSKVQLLPTNTSCPRQPTQPLALSTDPLPPIRDIIEFLVEHSALDEHTLLEHERHFSQGNPLIAEMFKILTRKFQKLRKTKQEMTKYCMRKAFKFIADRMRCDRTHNRDVDSCMKLYFSKTHTGAAFSIPFKYGNPPNRKNSLEKTMNGNFLKRVFAAPSFIDDYRDFLKEFQALMAEDNEKKIHYLADVLEKCIRASDLKKVEAIKRLPWTRATLATTEKLAHSLTAYAEGKTSRLKDQ